MGEHHIRCRFYPHCGMHLNQERPRQFSDENRMEMSVLRHEGWLLKEIADAFETSTQVVAKILNDRRK